MGRRKSKRRPARQSGSTAKKPAPQPGASVQEAHAEAMADMTPEQRRAAERDAEATTPDDPAEAGRLLRAARTAYTDRLKTLDDRERTVVEREQKLTNREVALDADRAREEQRWASERDKLAAERRAVDDARRANTRRSEELDGERDTLAARRRALDAREREANARDAALIEREQIAEAGFIDRDKACLAALHDQLATLRAEADDIRAALLDERAAFEEQQRARREALAAAEADRRAEAHRALTDELTARREAAEAELTARREAAEAALTARREAAEAALSDRRAALDAEHTALTAREGALREDRLALEVEQSILAGDRAALADEIERRCADRIARLEADLRAERARKETIDADRQRLADTLDAQRVLDRAYGDDPAAVRAELERLRIENHAQRQELAARPGLAAEERLVDLDEQLRAARADYADLHARKAEADAQLSKLRVEAATVEQLRDQQEVLETHRDTLRLALADLRDEVEAARGADDQQNPFRECAQMDAALDDAEPLDTRPLDLADFADRIRHRVAHDPDNSERRLCYAERHIRSFIAGLAMSPLHLLQGISGTGKTSLPRHFARAIGTGHMEDAAVELIEVQAGWRDQLDLLGHYNAFQRRFAERSFLKALYRAGTPAYAGRPFIIVLDEMNLSRPEQYFATLLSAIERSEDAEIELMEHRPGQHPRRFTRGGTHIALPDNVWFVGTANHDESTLEFADKTHDRAHVMNLPRQRDPFEYDAGRAEMPQTPLALDALRAAFERARKAHGEAAREALALLEAETGDVLRDRFGVGWGNRLEGHVERYAPVVVAAGGSMGEALDHMLATKILRKVCDRYDTSTDDIDVLRDAIEGCWAAIDGAEPTDALALLARDRRRIERGSAR